MACLDPKASRSAEDQVDAFGCNCIDDFVTTVDISEGVQLVADNSHWHPAFSRFGSVPGSNPSQTTVGMQQPEAAAEESDVDDSMETDIVDDESDEDALEESDTLDSEGLAPTDELVVDNEDGGVDDVDELFPDDELESLIIENWSGQAQVPPSRSFLGSNT